MFFISVINVKIFPKNWLRDSNLNMLIVIMHFVG
jgi:hypothetical protein